MRFEISLTENKALTCKVSQLEKTISEIKNTFGNKKSFAEVVAAGISLPKSQVSIKSATINASEEEARRSSVVIRHTEANDCDITDVDLTAKLAVECRVSQPVSVFRLRGNPKAPPLLKVQFNSKEEASHVLKTYDSVKENIPALKKSVVRPDLCKSDLAKYRNSWKEAILKNNELKKRVYTVRNLELVQIKYMPDQEPFSWEVRPSRT
uniref:Uncharacterized protein n=1 Tax=Caenorhabditis japonica TaxID=281687 RepID=A0A8R1DUD6_CAEJA